MAGISLIQKLQKLFGARAVSDMMGRTTNVQTLAQGTNNPFARQFSKKYLAKNPNGVEEAAQSILENMQFAFGNRNIQQMKNFEANVDTLYNLKFPPKPTEAKVVNIGTKKQVTGEGLESLKDDLGLPEDVPPTSPLGQSVTRAKRDDLLSTLQAKSYSANIEAFRRPIVRQILLRDKRINLPEEVRKSLENKTDLTKGADPKMDPLRLLNEYYDVDFEKLDFLEEIRITAGNEFEAADRFLKKGGLEPKKIDLSKYTDDDLNNLVKEDMALNAEADKLSEAGMNYGRVKEINARRAEIRKIIEAAQAVPESGYGTFKADLALQKQKTKKPIVRESLDDETVEMTEKNLLDDSDDDIPFAQGGRAGFSGGGITRLLNLLRGKFGDEAITTANKIARPESALNRDMFKEFNERVARKTLNVPETPLGFKLSKERLLKNYPEIDEDFANQIMAMDRDMQIRIIEMLKNRRKNPKAYDKLLMEKGDTLDFQGEFDRSVQRSKNAQGGIAGQLHLNQGGRVSFALGRGTEQAIQENKKLQDRINIQKRLTDMLNKKQDMAIYHAPEGVAIDPIYRDEDLITADRPPEPKIKAEPFDPYDPNAPFYFNRDISELDKFVKYDDGTLYNKDTGEYYNIETGVQVPGPSKGAKPVPRTLEAAEGGRVGLQKGGPPNKGRRNFLKLMAGLASLPVVGKLFKFAKPASKIVPLQKTSTAMPEWFPKFVDKFIDSSIAKKIDEDITEFKNPDLPDVKVTRHDDGRTFVEGNNEYNEGYQIDYQPPGYEVVDYKTGKAVKTQGEFEAVEGRHYALGPEDYDTEPFFVADLDELTTIDVAEMEKYATGKVTKTVKNAFGEDTGVKKGVRDYEMAVGKAENEADILKDSGLLDEDLATGGRVGLLSGGGALKALLKSLAKEKGMSGSEMLAVMNYKALPSKIRNLMTKKQFEQLKNARLRGVENFRDMMQTKLDFDKSIKAGKAVDTRNIGLADLFDYIEESFSKRSAVPKNISEADVLEMEQLIKNMRMKGRKLNATGGLAGQLKL